MGILEKVGLIALVLLVGFVGGLKVQEWRFDAKERAGLVKQIKQLREDVQQAKHDHDAVSATLAKAEAQNSQQRLDYERRLRDERKRGTQLVVGCESPVDTEPKPAGNGGGAPSGPPDAGDHRPMLTGDFVRLWNIALNTGEGAGVDPGPADGEGEATGPADPWDALDNLEENAGRWKECRDALGGWQDLARRRGWVSQAAGAP